MVISSISTAEETYTLYPGTNRIQSISGRNTRYEYDAAGNRAKREGYGDDHVYEYDAFNRLVRVFINGDQANPVEYHYNNNNQRYAKTLQNGTRIFYQYNPDGNLAAEANADGTITTIYIYARGTLVGLVHEGKKFDVLVDHLGRPERVVYGSTTYWEANNLPFDRRVVLNSFSGGYQLNIGYPGQYYDAETGLWYNWHRYYDARTGAYITSDPIGLEGGMNTYTYALNNPLRVIDSTGLQVSGIYDKGTGILTITNLDNGETVSTSAFSGTPGIYSPAPNGTYTISDFPWGKSAKDHYFAMLLHDGRIDDYADGHRSNYNKNKTMSGIRLHSGFASHGCVTVPGKANSKTWLKVQKMIQDTSLGTPIKIGGEIFPNYGIIEVKGAGFGSTP